MSSVCRIDKNAAGRLRKNTGIILYINIFDGQGNTSILSLPSVIEDVLRDDCFLIRAPQDTGDCLSGGGLFFMRFAGDPEGVGMPVSFAEKMARADTVYAKIKCLSLKGRSQHRSCYRFPVALPVMIGRENAEAAPYVSARTVNFSDGGILLTTDEALGEQEKITLFFNAGRHETVKGIVLRTERLEGEKHSFWAAIRFYGVDARQKQRFYRFVVEKQIQTRRWHGNSVLYPIVPGVWPEPSVAL